MKTTPAPQHEKEHIPEKNRKDAPLYSVIIPTYNRKELLGECLRAVAHQSIDKNVYEIIVVDDGSEDDTPSVVKHAKDNLFKNIHYIYQKNAGCGAARNKGVVKASGDILFFTDDDCVVPHTWMETLLNGFSRDEKIMGVGGWYSASQTEIASNPYAKIGHLIHRLGYHNYEDYEVITNDEGINPFGNTANIAYKKEVFERVGFFDTYTKKTAMIDYEFRLRVLFKGLYTLYIPLVIEHKKTITFSEFKNQAIRYGIANYYLSIKYRDHHHVKKIVNIFSHLASLKRIDSTVSAPLAALQYALQCYGAIYAKRKKIWPRKKELFEITPRTYTQTFVTGEVQEQKTYSRQDFFDDEIFVHARSKAYSLLEKEYQTPLISIVIPCFNNELYTNDLWADTFNFLEGTSSAVEIIFVNDGSTDTTKKMLEKIKHRIRFSTQIINHTTNRGAAATRNSGIQAARGEYIFFTDSDILVQKKWLSTLLIPFLVDERIGFSGGHQEVIGAKNHFDVWKNKSVPKHASVVIGTMFTNGLPSDTANFAIKKSLLAEKGVLYFDERFVSTECEDLDYTITLKQKGILGAYIPYGLYSVRPIHLKSFISHCIVRADGILKIRNKHTWLKTVIPSFFFTPNIYDTITTLFVFIIRRKQKVFLLSQIKDITITGRENNSLYLILKSLKERL